MKIINNSTRDRGIPGTKVNLLPAGAEMPITPKELEALKKFPMIRAWIHSGAITISKSKANPKKAVAKPAKPPKPTGVYIQEQENGKYRLMVNGIDVSQEDMTKAKAIKLADNYK